MIETFSDRTVTTCNRTMTRDEIITLVHRLMGVAIAKTGRHVPVTVPAEPEVTVPLTGPSPSPHWPCSACQAPNAIVAAEGVRLLTTNSAPANRDPQTGEVKMTCDIDPHTFQAWLRARQDRR